MKKNKNLLILIAIVLIILLVLIGVVKPKTSKDLLKYYNNSVISEKIKSYKLDLRIFDKKNTNKIIIIENYNNKNIITNIHENDIINTYLYDGTKKYMFVDNENRYRQTERDYIYDNPNLFLEGLKNITEVKEIKSNKEETDCDTDGATDCIDDGFKKYNVVFSKKFANKMLKDISLPNKAVKDIKGQVWIDNDNRVYKVYYYVGDLTVYASYFGYNMVDSDIVLRELGK